MGETLAGPFIVLKSVYLDVAQNHEMECISSGGVEMRT
jgi:hypothetical protein